MIGTPGLGYGKYYKYVLAWDIVTDQELRELRANIKIDTREDINKQEKEALKIMRSCPSPEIVRDCIEQRHISDYVKC